MLNQDRNIKRFVFRIRSKIGNENLFFGWFKSSFLNLDQSIPYNVDYVKRCMIEYTVILTGVQINAPF